MSRIRMLFLLLLPVVLLSAVLREVPLPASSSAVLPVSAADWGLSFQTEGAAPVGNATMEHLAQYNACYLGDTGKNVIYLKRLSIGGLALDPALEPGAVRELTPEEIASFMK